jgi:hypothetical protein
MPAFLSGHQLLGSLWQWILLEHAPAAAVPGIGPDSHSGKLSGKFTWETP